MSNKFDKGMDDAYLGKGYPGGDPGIEYLRGYGYAESLLMQDDREQIDEKPQERTMKKKVIKEVEVTSCRNCIFQSEGVFCNLYNRGNYSYVSVFKKPAWCKVGKIIVYGKEETK